MSASSAPARAAIAMPSPVACTGIGGVAVETSDTAGREHGGIGGKGGGRCAGGVATVHAAYDSVFDDQIGGGDVLDDVDGRVSGHGFDERAQNRVSGRVAARFDDSTALMRGFASEHELARVVAIEGRAELEQFFDARGRVAREDLDDLFVANAGSGALRVDRVKAR